MFKYGMDSSIHIPGRDIVTLLHSEAKRRSKVAELLDRAPTLTDEEIASADVPLPWYRKALTLVRDRAKAAVIAQSLDTDVSGLVRHGHNPDPTGEIREYLGESIWVRSGSSEIEVPYGKWCFFLHAGGIWVDTALCSNDARLYHGSRLVEVATKLRYHEARQEHLLRYHSDAPVIASEAAQATRPGQGMPPPLLAGMGVRFSR